MKTYPDYGHPPWFSLREGKLYPDYGHPVGIGTYPSCRVQNDRPYSDYGHPDGIGATPWYQFW